MNKIIFPQELLLTNRQVANLRKTFANYLSSDIKLSKTQISKKMQSGGFLGRIPGSLLKTGLPLMKNVIKPLAKSVLIPLGLAAAVSGSGRPLFSLLHNNNNAILIISNDEMKDTVEIVESLEDSGLLPERANETIQNKAKEQRGQFLSMLLGRLGASLLGDILKDRGINRAGKRIVRAGSANKRQYYERKTDF